MYRLPEYGLMVDSKDGRTVGWARNNDRRDDYMDGKAMPEWIFNGRKKEL
jgi:hypothetical protein